MYHLKEDHEAGRRPMLPSGFKYVIGLSALFIAGCSAFFSVCGLGFLFVGSAMPVMIMASSLEIGKLVAASFLYRYWNYLNRLLKIYLTTAVLVLIGITSLGNYGYLARAYERTHTRIAAYEDQIEALKKEIADANRQIEAHRGQIGRNTDASREDIAKLQQRITELNALLEQSLARIDERRKTAQQRRDNDIQLPKQQQDEKAELLKKAIASEESAIADLNERMAVLDRAVDAYTKQGGADILLLKPDSVRKGQELREKQRPEREVIAGEIAGHRARQEQLRADHAKAAEAAGKELEALRAGYAKELAALGSEEQALRDSHAGSVAQVQQQLAALQSQGKTVIAGGDTQIESIYKRIRSCNEEIQRMRQQIGATDIGPYRFVSRAFDASADAVVMWLTLVLVLVFDPLAVSLFIGFNVALLADPRGRHTPLMPDAPSSGPAGQIAPAATRRNRWMFLGTSLLLIIFTIGLIYAAVKWGAGTWSSREGASHAAFIPGDSFAVVALRPADLQSSPQYRNVLDALGVAAGTNTAEMLTRMFARGIDPGANLYAFAKFPAKREESRDERPSMLCGFVARVTDVKAAEDSFSQLAERLTGALRASATNPPALSRNRMMVQYGKGRYLDPEGGFFTFGITKRIAIFMVEFEGDPGAPEVENEIRLCLAPRDSNGYDGDARAHLPERALGKGNILAAWLDADRFFKNIPKNAAALARYEQLRRYLSFDLVLKIQPDGSDRLNVMADYIYQADRFSDKLQTTAIQQIAALGPAAPAGIAGQLMDRCADTLDYDSLIERLRLILGSVSRKGVPEVVVEKSVTSPTEARFGLIIRCKP